MAEKQFQQKMVLCCGGRKKCPEISLESDGSFVLQDADQSAPGRVVLTREQAIAVVQWITMKMLSNPEVLQVYEPTPDVSQLPGHEGEDAVDRAFRQGNL